MSNAVGTPSPAVSAVGHHTCTCGIPEPVTSCSCDRPLRGPLELGSCHRCRFWLRHLNDDHRPWHTIPEEISRWEKATGKKW